MDAKKLHRPMPPEIRAALRLLQQECDRKDIVVPPAREVRLALRTLLPFCPERWPLDQFWNAVHGDHPIGRWQNLNASLNGIHRQLGLPYGWTG